MPALLFALTLAASAFLLFSVQPLVARMALPVLGGTPSVWNTSMCFFQAVVLAGYALAHLLATRTRPATQAAVFALVIGAGGCVLPVALARGVTAPPDQPLAWLLTRLTLAVGLPALALSIASPLLQRWFSRAQPGAGEPYSLYAASNAGSLGALLAYPTLAEPWLTIPDQALAWRALYWTWAALVAAVALVTLRASRPAPVSPSHPAAHELRPAPPSSRTTLVWVALAAIPASLLQGCTLFLTTDVASIPLLWVVPLALYLVSTIVAFAAWGRPWVTAAARLVPFLAAALLYAILTRATQPVLLLVALHLGFLLAAGLACHGRLVALRPPPEHLTAFYLALAAGGVLGGAFNALAAPVLFRSLAEYPLAIALAAAALPRRPSARPAASPARESLQDLATAAALGSALVCLGLIAPWLFGDQPRLRDALVFGTAAVACCTLLDRPRRLALGLASAFLAGLWLQGLWAGHQHVERNFFGITRVARGGGGEYHQLVHGNTIHGRQFLDPARRAVPLTYYHPEGPLGRIFESLPHRARPPADPAPGASPARMGVVGLGIGSMAAYARPDEDWTFFEIDPAVIRVARDPRWFGFLADTRARSCRIVEGDARLQLEAEPDGSFQLLVLDAFSSDAIPVHLLTREAVALYFRKLGPGGWLALHVSNRYLELEPVVAGLAADAGLACRSADDTDEGTIPGKEPSHWMLLARTPEDLGAIRRQSWWVPAQTDPAVPLWTDQRSALLPVFQWR